MIRRFIITMGLLSTIAFAAISCKETPQEDPQEDPVTAPVASVEINALDRT